MTTRKNSQSSTNNGSANKHRSPTPDSAAAVTSNGIVGADNGGLDAAPTAVRFSRKSSVPHRRGSGGRNGNRVAPSEVEALIVDVGGGGGVDEAAPTATNGGRGLDSDEEDGLTGHSLLYFEGDVDRARVQVDRPALNQLQFHERFQFEDSMLLTPARRKAATAVRRWWHECTIKAMLVSVFPILDWLPRYKWREDLFSDLSAGFTVAVMHIPQGMAYALLANVNAITGLYTAFFPVLVYVLMGTSAHISLGTFAIISLLLASVVDEHSTAKGGDQKPDPSNNATTPLSPTTTDGQENVISPEQVVAAVALVCGFWLLLFCLLRVSVFVSLLSHSLIRGFTTGAAIQVFSSQVRHILGVSVDRFEEPFSLFKLYYFIFSNLAKVKLVTLALSFTVIALLELYSLFLENRLNQLLRGVVFPIHLAVVLLGILVSWALKLHDEYQVDIVGFVSSGMPTPSLPPPSLLPDVIFSSFTVAVVSFVITYSLANLMALKHKYKIRPNQELLAGGFCNIVGGFFSCLPVATSLSRTLVQDNAGCRTLLTSATSAFLLLWVLLFAGPFFEPLPNAVLSGIIVHALKGLFKQCVDLPVLWRHSKLDFSVWVVTFGATVLAGAQVGLIAGVALNLFSLVYWCLHPRLKLMGETDFRDVNPESKYFRDVKESHHVVMAQLSGCFNFSNANHVEDMVYEMVAEAKENFSEDKIKPTYFLLDLGGISSLDYSACMSLRSMCKHLREDQSVKMGLVAVTGSAWHKMEEAQVFAEVHRHRCFPSLQDALASLETKLKKAQ